MSEELTFEETLKQLEDVVARLERGDSLTLNESLTAFEEGVRLTRLCRKTLDDAELRVQQLIEDDESEMDVPPTGTEGETPQSVESEVSSATDDDIPF
jgi:exodeoxyribonuclease VII small subunit